MFLVMQFFCSIPLIIAGVGRPPKDFPSALKPVYQQLAWWANHFMDSKIVVPLLSLLGASALIVISCMVYRLFRRSLSKA